jgi:hypothetical protein
MADEKPNQPSRAEQMRRRAAQQQKDVIAAFERVSKTSAGEQMAAAIQAVGTALVWALSYIPEIAAELAEANSRDREAEIRSKNAEAFVEGLQQEIGRQQSGLLIPGGAVQVTPRGK